ncbi:unnamed protein product [Adineta ricciae]|uniref:Uncharacterized protein n=1 Tax=Adineta ricciae TaxID=249248 RepID=A0A815L7N8_ADIRI|nr:unnamed protein product [Adineta ricciae]
MCIIKILSTFLHSIKVNIAKLKVIRFVHSYDSCRDAEIVLRNQIEDINIVLSKDKTVSLEQISMESFEYCFGNILSNTKRSVVPRFILAMKTCQLAGFLSKQIRLLDIATRYEMQNLAKPQYDHFDHLKELHLLLSYGGFSEISSTLSKFIMNLFITFPRAVSFYTADDVFQPIIGYLDPNEIANVFEIKRCGQYFCFAKIMNC